MEDLNYNRITIDDARPGSFDELRNNWITFQDLEKNVGDEIRVMSTTADEEPNLDDEIIAINKKINCKNNYLNCVNSASGY